FTVALLSLAASALPLALGVKVSYDPVYDNADQSLDTVACSDGPNGLETLHYTTFGSLPGFPYIGGTDKVEGWNSAQCGTCWQLQYNGKYMNIVAVDHADEGFNISEEAMNELTGGQAEQLGEVDVTVTQVDKAFCWL
ncbi:hypothetical protein GLOTRDRAFT_9070, partial [Gloeophyllum trabeum ATCC 11539]